MSIASQELIELNAVYDIRTKELAAIREEARDPDTGAERTDNIKSVENPIEVMGKLNKELNDTVAKMDKLQQVEEMEADQKRREDWANEPKSRPSNVGFSQAQAGEPLGKQFIESDMWRKFSSQGMRGDSGLYVANMDLKALFNTTSYAPEATRTGDVVPLARRPSQLLPRIRQVPTDQPSVVYMEQTTRTDPADMGIAEGSAYSPATLVYTQRTQAVEKRGVFIDVTDEVLADTTGMQSMVSDDLVDMLGEDIDEQIVSGDGSSDNLMGFTNKSGVTSVEAASDSTPIALLDGIRSVRTTGRSVVDLICMNSIDFYNMRKLQEVGGAFIHGRPTDALMFQEWGVPIVLVDALPAGTALVGAFGTHCYVRDRQDVNVQITMQWQVTTAPGQTIPTGRQVVIVDARLAFVIRRAAAFAKVTGL